ncbi:MAG TPA: FAD/NAD(P)-binding protein, partial [Sphingomicrobium sp.]|nr:FAD/NAD(P)-binding protein [Sphingomicrobium sp.]
VPVAIVGGGASGTILAAQLARLGIRTALIEGAGRAGRGIAYSTTEPAHLLNVRADGMSAWAGDPEHFAKRFEAHGGHRSGFAERRFFGRYLGDILDEAVVSGCTYVVDQSAIRAEPANGKWRLLLDDDSAIEAHAIALAMGNQEPQALRAFEGTGDRFISNPWGAEARRAVDELALSGGDALLVGTSLTMVDLVLSLESAGHRGGVLALSRRGQIPRAHGDFEPGTVDAGEVPHGGLGAIWRWLRQKSAEVGWRAAIDSLRPHSHELWQSLDVGEQRRFLRHARPWWDVHRHRIAPEVAATIARLVAEGRLEVMAGRTLEARRGPDGLDVELRRRGSAAAQRRRFAYAFNCTGPLHAIDQTRDPLLRSLIEGGSVRPDDLGIGLEVDENSRAGERLWALGPLTKGRYWEIIAVPDIRDQAALVADDIVRELKE